MEPLKSKELKNKNFDVEDDDDDADLDPEMLEDNFKNFDEFFDEEEDED